MNQLVAAARTLLGKPFRHRARGPHYYDCAGTIKEPYRLNGVHLPDFKLYGREPHDDGLVTYVTAALGDPVAVSPVRAEQLQPGDVIIVRFDISPHHLAWVTDYPHGGLAMLHACGHNNKVIEHRLAPDQIKRITHVFRRPV